MGTTRVGPTVALVALAIIASAATGCGTSCSQSAFEGVDFDGTVQAVADDGTVTFTVDSVTAIEWRRDTAETVFGVPNDTRPPVLATVVPGATVTVGFPKEQVEHVRRDIGKQYRVIAAHDESTGQLTTVLNDAYHPCASTKLAE